MNFGCCLCCLAACQEKLCPKCLTDNSPPLVSTAGCYLALFVSLSLCVFVGLPLCLFLFYVFFLFLPPFLSFLFLHLSVCLSLSIYLCCCVAILLVLSAMPCYCSRVVDKNCVGLFLLVCLSLCVCMWAGVGVSSLNRQLIRRFDY